jgi:hypothetical protein
MIGRGRNSRPQNFVRVIKEQGANPSRVSVGKNLSARFFYIFVVQKHQKLWFFNFLQDEIMPQH